MVAAIEQLEVVKVRLGLVEFWIASDREGEEGLDGAEEVSLPL